MADRSSKPAAMTSWSPAAAAISASTRSNSANVRSPSADGAFPAEDKKTPGRSEQPDGGVKSDHDDHQRAEGDPFEPALVEIARPRPPQKKKRGDQIKKTAARDD